MLSEAFYVLSFFYEPLNSSLAVRFYLHEMLKGSL